MNKTVTIAETAQRVRHCHGSMPNLSVRKFYFLEYYYILLKSIQRYSDREHVFDSFKLLKQEHRLGESRFRKLTIDAEDLTPTQLSRYRYTFGQVIEDCKEFNLITDTSAKSLVLTDAGRELLSQFGTDDFNHILFCLMEQRSHAFRYLVSRMYEANQSKSGLLIFPIYSPHQLGLDRSDIRTAADVRHYAKELAKQLTNDMNEYLGQVTNLTRSNDVLVKRLQESGILPESDKAPFPTAKYNAIVSRCRKYWLDYFLKDVYAYDLSLSAFDLWIYRGKQIGLIHVTESYPNFNGRIVYPTCVVAPTANSPDFRDVFQYPDDRFRLYVHKPGGEKRIDQFVEFLLDGYLALRRTHRSYFINLLSLRELVCYNLRISEAVFETLLEATYQLNLANKLRIRISLEVDKLPGETKATYQKQDPVMVDGRYRNIIAIDITKGDPYNDQ